MDNTTHIEHKDFPPCQMACPILTDTREYVQFIAERRFEEAFASIRKLNPLPRVCGRICIHPCEIACKRGQIEEPISIASLKRFASDGPWADHYKVTLPEKSTGYKVAVVGSGPAGLSAAHDLALLGHHVTIFEALPVLGGMLRVGVPAYRLPKDVLDEQIQAILDLGIEVKTGVLIGEDIKLSDLFEHGYKAVFVAIGAHKEHKLGIAGEDELEGVVSAVSFLRQVNQGENPEIGKRVAVIGGGNTAIDSARAALRLCADAVYIVYRRSRKEMPAEEEEIEEAIHEGIQLFYLTSPLEVIGHDGKVLALNCIKNELGEPDGSGRRSPKHVPGSEFALDVDMVIAAIGQVPDSSLLADELELVERGNRIHLEAPNTLATTLAGVFAGGDAVTGPATVVKAIAAGKEVAISMDCYLRGESPPTASRTEVVETKKLPSGVVEKTQKFARCHKISLPIDERLKGFDEVESVLSEDLAVQEALRCLHCNLGASVNTERCISCLNCVHACPVGAPATTKMGKINIDRFLCQACGICALECPVQAIDIGLHPRGELGQQIKKAVSMSEGTAVVGFFDYQGSFGHGDVSSLKKQYPGIAPIMVFGLRRVDTSDVLNAFEAGADAVLLAGCPSAREPFAAARSGVTQRMAQAKAILDVLGLDGRRLQVFDMPERGLVDEEHLTEFMHTIADLGPNPLR